MILNTVILGLLGLIVGSFLAAVSVRLPAEEDVVVKRSHCRSCGATLKPWHLVPLVSWLVLRGRCGMCRAEISPRYPLIEVAAGLIGVWAAVNGGGWIVMGATAVLGWQLLLIALIDALRVNYEAAGVQAELVPFIDDMAKSYADADLVICRAGATTVTEIAAIGAAALFVPFPHAVDDHQTTNAKFLVDQGAGWLIQQRDLTPERLAEMLQKTERSALVQRALAAKKMQKIHAVEDVVTACEELTAR